MIKVGIYTRLSDEDRDKKSKEDDSQSIQNQKAMLIQYALDHQWDIYDIYVDDDFTGSDRNRPEWNRLIEDAKNHKVDIVLCKSQARFTRELEMVEKYIHGLFPIWGIRFVSIVDNADTEIKGNKKSRQINGLVNEWYLEDMSENIKSVLINRRQNGYHIGAFSLYGYMKDPDKKGHLIIDEDAADIVREVFTLFAQGYGKTAIARILNDRGVPNPTEYKRLKGFRYMQPKATQSTLWKYFAISNMLINEIYIGHMVQGKYGSVSYKTKQNKPRPKDRWIKVEDTHEPIIDHELWERVQSLVEQKAKPFIVGQIGLFARKVKCMNCGYILRSNKNHGKYYLQCANRHVAKDACIGAFASVERLERTVLQELKKLCSEYLDKGFIEKSVEFQDTIKQDKEIIFDQIQAYRNKLAECEKGVKTLYLDKIKGILDDNTFMSLSREFQKDKLFYEKGINDYEEQLAKLERKALSFENKKLLIDEYMGLEKLTREMVDTLIDYISVGKKDRATNQLPVEIHWNF